MTKPPAPLRLGVLGCARIARHFVRDVAASRALQVVACASRSADNAAAFAAATGIARHHGSYEALLDDRTVDAVYLPLPNSLHAPWAVRAAQAGKHVLCEKPLALNLAQARQMVDAARAAGVVLLESYPYWFQPQTGAMLRLLHDGAIGELRSVQASFGFTLSNPQTNIRMRPELGGGALLDAGSYPVSLIRLVMGAAPQRVQAFSTWSEGGAEDSVDLSTDAVLLFADGRRAQLSCAMNTATHRHATLVGSQGTLETEYLNHVDDRPPPARRPRGQPASHPLGWLPSLMRLRRGVANSTAFETVEAPGGSGFRFAAEAFARLVSERDFAARDRAAAASLDIAATLGALARSARSGQPEAVLTATAAS